MIVVEKLENGLTRTYSDAGFMICQENGDLYMEAIDIVEHVYTETDEPIPSIKKKPVLE